mmetsp:Transcript_858/g.2465  ORF Transcript_858/g.2465 Transcript_858/m.2465 type:complete len:306 (-) Transcript_858:52-969(-)
MSKSRPSHGRATEGVSLGPEHSRIEGARTKSTRGGKHSSRRLCQGDSSRGCPKEDIGLQKHDVQRLCGVWHGNGQGRQWKVVHGATLSGQNRATPPGTSDRPGRRLSLPTHRQVNNNNNNNNCKMPTTTTRVISTSAENVPIPVDRNGYPIPPKQRSGKPNFFQRLGDSIEDALNSGNDLFSKKHPQKNLTGTKTTTVTETTTTQDDGTIIKVITTTVQHPSGTKDVSEQRSVIPTPQTHHHHQQQPSAPYEPSSKHSNPLLPSAEQEIVVPMATAIPIQEINDNKAIAEPEITVPAATAPYEDK